MHSASGCLSSRYNSFSSVSNVLPIVQYTLHQYVATLYQNTFAKDLNISKTTRTDHSLWDKIWKNFFSWKQATKLLQPLEIAMAFRWPPIGKVVTTLPSVLTTRIVFLSEAHTRFSWRESTAKDRSFVDVPPKCFVSWMNLPLLSKILIVLVQSAT